MMLHASIRPDLARHWYIWLLLAVVVGCTKRNPDLCCTTDAECAAIGFSSHAPCDLGVCVKNACTTDTGPCDDDADCPAATPACVANTCAVCTTSATCPSTAPVCDAASHDCRLCTKDNECDSLACDLATGNCVSPDKVRYASPAGDETKPCSRALPCSLSQAAITADFDHPYIALLPGTHVTGASFDGKTVIVCGNDTTYDANGGSSFVILNGSAVTFRDLKILQTEASDQNDSTIFNSNKSSLLLNNVQIDVAAKSFFTISQFAGTALTIQHSTFKGAAINLARTNVKIDQSLFLEDTTLDIDTTETSLEVTNSVFAMSTHGLLRIADSSSEFGQNFIHSNTFFGTSIECSRDGRAETSFNANIFYNTIFSLGSGTTGCIYNHNILPPGASVSGTDNMTADPRFVSIDSRDFHLQATSPAIDPAADAEQGGPHSSHDFDGTSRPQGIRSDIGAFEYVRPGTP